MNDQSPLQDICALLSDLPAPEAAASQKARQRMRTLAREGHALGELGEFAAWLAGWSGARPAVSRPHVALFAGTHEIDRLGISALPPSYTQTAVERCAAGAAPVSLLCAQHDLGLRLFDLALEMRVGDITSMPALDERGCAATMAFGMEAIADGADLICLGSISIGGPVSAAALMHALKGGEAADWVGQPDDRFASRKAAVVAQAVALHGAEVRDPLQFLRRLGGRETAAIAGAILAARTQRIPVVLDGTVALAAAAVLHAVEPTALAHCVVAETPLPPAWRQAAAELGLKAVGGLGIGDGEGTAGAVAVVLLRMGAQAAATPATGSEQ